jgi:hypothetical protein
MIRKRQKGRDRSFHKVIGYGLDGRSSYSKTGLGIFPHYTVTAVQSCSTVHRWPCLSWRPVVFFSPLRCGFDLRAIHDGFAATGFTSGTLRFPSQYHSNESLHSFIIQERTMGPSEATLPTTTDSIHLTNRKKGPSNLLSNWYRSLETVKLITQPYLKWDLYVWILTSTPPVHDYCITLQARRIFTFM